MKRIYRIFADHRPSLHLERVEFSEDIISDSAEEAKAIFDSKHQDKLEYRFINLTPLTTVSEK